MRIIGYSYEAELHCVKCAINRFGYGETEDPDQNNISMSQTDSEGNLVTPVFDITEIADSERYCGGGGGELEEAPPSAFAKNTLTQQRDPSASLPDGLCACNPGQCGCSKCADCLNDTSVITVAAELAGGGEESFYINHAPEDLRHFTDAALETLVLRMQETIALAIKTQARATNEQIRTRLRCL